MGNHRYLLSPALAAVLALGLGACEQRSPGPLEMSAEPTASELIADPERLGRLGARLEADPESAEELLEREGMTLADFADAVRAVSADVELAERYQQGYLAEQGGAEESGGTGS
jgi:hypothetical protein